MSTNRIPQRRRRGRRQRLRRPAARVAPVVGARRTPDDIHISWLEDANGAQAPAPAVDVVTGAAVAELIRAAAAQDRDPLIALLGTLSDALVVAGGLALRLDHDGLKVAFRGRAFLVQVRNA